MNASAKVGRDDPPGGPGQPNPPKRLDRSLFRRDEGTASRTQNIPPAARGGEAEDDDDGEDKIQEILARFRDGGVEMNDGKLKLIEHILRQYLAGAGKPAQGGRRMETHGGSEASQSYELPVAAQDALTRGLPRHDLHGVQPAAPRARPVSAQAVTLAEKLAPATIGMRVM